MPKRLLQIPFVVGLGLVVALAVAGCSEGRSAIKVDHRTSTAAKPLPDTGPAAGRFRQLWTTKVKPTGETALGFRTVGGDLVMIEGERLRAFDARTGKPTWHYAERGRDLRGTAITKNTIVVNTPTTAAPSGAITPSAWRRPPVKSCGRTPTSGLSPSMAGETIRANPQSPPVEPSSSRRTALTPRVWARTLTVEP